LDAGVRMEGIPSMDLWEEVLNVFGDDTKTPPKVDYHSGMLPHTPSVGNNVADSFQTEADLLANVDYVPHNIPTSPTKAKLTICEDNEAVIKMAKKARSPNMRHCARTQRVDLDWLFERLLKDKNIRIEYVNTKQQMADMFTKGSFSASTWSTLCKLLNVGLSYPLKTSIAKTHTLSSAATLLAAQRTCPLGLQVDVPSSTSLQ